MSTSIRQAAGSLLVVGLSSPQLSSLESAWLKLVRPAGIILFRRNIVDATATRSLNAFSETSTMEARPDSSIWDSLLII